MGLLKKIGRIGLLIATVVAIAVGYIGYRYMDAARYERMDEELAHLSEREFLAATADLAPVHCRSEQTGFGSSRVAAIYAANGRLKIEETYFHYNAETHILYDTSGAYIWEKDGDVVYRDELSEQAEQDTDGSSAGELSDYIVDAMICEPWWFVDESKFELPGNRLVEPYRPEIF